MNKFVRLIFIRVEKQQIQRKIDKIYNAYLVGEEGSEDEMDRLQEQYNKLYREEMELRKDE